MLDTEALWHSTQSLGRARIPAQRKRTIKLQLLDAIFIHRCARILQCPIGADPGLTMPFHELELALVSEPPKSNTLTAAIRVLVP